jgi:hypothetical protein
MENLKKDRKPKPGPGRNKLPPEEKKSIKMQIFFTPSEHAEIVRKAELANLELNDFVRQLLASGIVTNIESKAVQDSKINLIKIGNNLNQIARIANANRMITELPKVNLAIDEVYELLESYRR